MDVFKVEDCDVSIEDFHFKNEKKGEKSDYEPMVYEEDNQSIDRGMKFAVVTLQDTDEVMVVASDWLSTDQKQCYWPPFKSPEKYLEAVKNDLEPSTKEKPWEKLDVVFHAKYDTYEEAVNNQVEQRALKDGLILYKVVTLQKSNELTVIPATWMNEEKALCHWPPFKSPEKCTEAVKSRFEPPVTVEQPWEMLNVEVHGECATYKQAKDKQKTFKEWRERSKISGAQEEMKKKTPPLLPVPSHFRTSTYGTKRKRDLESSDSSIKTRLTTDMIMEKARQTLKSVTKSSEQIDKGSRKKAIIGIFGKSGEGKSSLLSAILGKKDLIPSGCFGACTAVVTQVEANLTESNYTAEIELFSQEEWEEELKELFRDINDDSEDRNEDLIEFAIEKITALYGADADQKTLEELKNEEKFAEIETFLSVNKKIISNSDLSEFASDVASFIQHSESSPGGWFWPLVKSVTIKIPDCRELLEHIVLLDLPGTGDCNKTRDDLWKSKVRECSSVWIVSDINRAITDRDPWGILKHCTEELGPGGKCKSINFICTKTDDINPGAYIRSARHLKDQIPDDKDQKKTCILHRNKLVKTKVKEKFKNSEIKDIFNTDNQFKIFTVSSRAFFDHNLNLESSETEIPKLQDDLRNLNKSINRELTRDYVNKAKGVLSLIQSGQLDKDKKMIEMKVNEFEENLMKSLTELDKYFVNISKDLEQCLSNGVDESVDQCVASTKELIAPNKHARGFHKFLRALCKNYGCYWSKNWDVILDLNKTLAQHLHKHIYNDFCQIFPVDGKTGKSVQEQIDKFSIIQSDSNYPNSDILHHIHNYIKIEETKLKAAFNRDIVDMKKDIFSSIKITIVNEMASCYQHAATVRGPGSMKKMQELLITTIDNKKQDMFNKAKMEMLEKFNNLKRGVLYGLKTELQEVIERSQSQTSKKTRMDVSREIEELERLLEQLSD